MYPNKDFGSSGRDTYARAYGSGAPLNILAESYVEYKKSKNSFKVGRQGFESKFSATNDTKMVPNVFEGYSFVINELPDTTIKAGYFTQQKLRDHRDFHSVIAYGGYLDPEYGNDDSVSHKGLTFNNIRKHGEDTNPTMMMLLLQNRSINNLKLDFQGMHIDGFLSSFVSEANYRFNLNSKWSLTPALRYYKQRDDGAGSIGGSALSGTVSNISSKGYTDPDSVDASMVATRISLSDKIGKYILGYSQVSDDADIIAPWRAFPTGGYTRSMGQYNWEANTKSWMFRAYYNFDKAGLLSGVKTLIDYAQMDYDDNKLYLGGHDKTDSSIVHVDLSQSIKEIENLEFTLRAAKVMAKSVPNSTNDYKSYSEYRFEINYLF